MAINNNLFWKHVMSAYTVYHSHNMPWTNTVLQHKTVFVKVFAPLCAMCVCNSHIFVYDSYDVLDVIKEVCSANWYYEHIVVIKDHMFWQILYITYPYIPY